MSFSSVNTHSTRRRAVLLYVVAVRYQTNGAATTTTMNPHMTRRARSAPAIEPPPVWGPACGRTR